MKRKILIIIALISLNIASAQDFFNTLRYSQTEYGGSARSIAMGSAFGALGGDFASASINPAGLGFYRSNEFAFTPSLNINQINSSYLGNNESEERYRAVISNLSYVATVNTNSNSGLVSISFGAGLNRLKNFHSNSYIQGFDAKTSLLSYFTDYANDIGNPESFNGHYEGLVWDTWLIDEDPDPNVIEGVYYNDLTDYADYEIYDSNNNLLGIGYEATGIRAHQQKRISSRKGYIDEYLMSVGLNINHKLYMGASLGLTDLNYHTSVIYSEIDNLNKSDYLNDYKINTETTESGVGVNFKTGLIYRPFKSLRLGASFHTPTFYEMTFYEEKTVNAHYEQAIGNEELGFKNNWESSNPIRYYYNLATPSKINLSAAYSLSDKALFSVDYEMVNYAKAKIRESGDGYDYSDQNSDINNALKATGNLRVGTEVRVSPNISLRGGFNYFGNPWQTKFEYRDGSSIDIANSNDTYMAYTGGFGYRQKHFFIDFAYRLNQHSYVEKVHEILYTNPNNGSALANINEFNHQATITLGFRF